MTSLESVHLTVEDFVMTTYIQSDLATRVLRDLGLISAEEVPSAADQLLWRRATRPATATAT
jgi:hypothetical protein